VIRHWAEWFTVASNETPTRHASAVDFPGDLGWRFPAVSPGGKPGPSRRESFGARNPTYDFTFRSRTASGTRAPEPTRQYA